MGVSYYITLTIHSTLVYNRLERRLFGAEIIKPDKTSGVVSICASPVIIQDVQKHSSSAHGP